VSNSLTLVLVIAMVLSYATLDFIEGGVINAVIILNIVVGFFQDYRAEQTIQSLQAMAAPVSKVVRDGTLSTIKADDLVPGDIVHLSVGDIVSADLRLATSTNLATDEALLTGESKPCSKNAESIVNESSAPLGDRHNIAYSSTTVTRGRGTGVVVATGMSTEIGKIAFLLRDKKQTAQGNWFMRAYKGVLYAVKNALGLVGTPLQVKLSYFGLLLFGLAILLAIIVFSTAVWDIDGETLIYGICVAVAVIPESLIAVLTITMAVGSKAMAKGNVIVRKMGALEAIGGVTNICSDKTGTLTQGKMLARMAYLADGRTLAVQDETSPFDPTSGHVSMNGDRLEQRNIYKDPALRDFFQTIAVCNLASVVPPKDEAGLWSATGEPTEIALQVMAMRVGHSKEDVLSTQGLRLAAEHSFDSSVKRMTVVYEASDSQLLSCFTKGATEVILPLVEGMNNPTKKAINAQADAMATQGLRVLCLARRSLAASDRDSVESRTFVEHNLTFVGLVGLYDPPRLESASAIKQCQAAGITVHMLTGDHLKTATTIAQEIGILGSQVPGSNLPSAVMTAPDFDAMSDDELDRLETLPFVVARCSPTTKLRMLDTLHRRGKYCVMTGDGVNDSPALKGADVGVAMGLNGSDVSKEAADMVLTDDNFASIVSAIREGRRLFDNIQKVSIDSVRPNLNPTLTTSQFLLHLLISNIAQVVLLLIGLAFQDRNGVSAFPLSPLEILFANLITSSFLAIGLGLESASSDVMTRPPHSLRAGVFTKELIIDKFIYGTCMGSLCLISFVIVVYAHGDGDLGADCNHSYNDTCSLPFRARATAYSILTVLLSIMAWEAKHLTRSLFNMYPEEDSSTFSILNTLLKNRFLFWAVCAGLCTPFPIVYIPVINRVVFRHAPLSWEWGLVFGSVVCFVALVESWKAVKRRSLKKCAVARRLAAGSGSGSVVGDDKSSMA
jgi:Na+-exporting ATPase